MPLKDLVIYCRMHGSFGANQRARCCACSLSLMFIDRVLTTTGKKGVLTINSYILKPLLTRFCSLQRALQELRFLDGEMELTELSAVVAPATKNGKIVGSSLEVH
jgi:hypothetical protein